MLKLLCPSCRRQFMQLTPPGEEEVICPWCGTVFQPEEEEIYDPEDD